MFLNVSVFIINIDKHNPHNKSSLESSIIFKSLKGSWDQKVERSVLVLSCVIPFYDASNQHSPFSCYCIFLYRIYFSRSFFHLTVFPYSIITGIREIRLMNEVLCIIYGTCFFKTILTIQFRVPFDLLTEKQVQFRSWEVDSQSV